MARSMLELLRGSARPTKSRIRSGNRCRSRTSGGKMMTKRRAWLAAAAAGLVALGLPLGWVGADHVKIEVTPQPQPPSTTIIVPPPATQVVPAPPRFVVPTPAQMINADQIKADQVRADTIYANRIEADQVVGQVHQTRDVKIRDTRGDIRAPEVTAGTIYADEIKANSVIAQHVFVRDLRRR